MDNFYKHLYGLVKDKKCHYGENVANYILSTIKDILSDYELDLNDEDLYNLFLEIYLARPYAEVDNKILKTIQDKYNLDD